MKKIIRLTESDLHNIINESVNQILMEYGETPHGRYQIGRAIARRNAMGMDAKEMADHFTNQQGLSHNKRSNGDWDFDDEAMDDGYLDQEIFMDEPKYKTCQQDSKKCR